jgi:hypothetical protein
LALDDSSINLKPYFWFSTKLSKTLKNSLRIDEKVGQCNRKCSRSSSITRDRLLLDVTNKSSLDLYQYIYIKQGKQVYLDKQNEFKASWLKFSETFFHEHHKIFKNSLLKA